MTVREWVIQEQGKHFCHCGCGEEIIITKEHHRPSKGIPKYKNGHSNNENIKKWIDQEQGKHFCACGCGEKIKICKHHYYAGIPKIINRHYTEEYRKNISKAKIGKKASEETKRKMSEAQSGKNNSMFGKYHTEETKRKIGKSNWKGGLKIACRKSISKRRFLENIELNKDFLGSEGHHINKKYVINIPRELHRGKGNSHNLFTGRGMFESNKRAFKYLWNHQKDMLISIEEAFQINLIVNGVFKNDN